MCSTRCPEIFDLQYKQNKTYSQTALTTLSDPAASNLDSETCYPEVLRDLLQTRKENGDIFP